LHTKFYLGNSKGRDHFRYLGTGERVILKFFLKKDNVKFKTELN
jgi:hypothetical protein